MFKVKREELLKGFTILNRIIKSTPTMPILSNVLIDSENNKGLIVGTDLEVGIKYYFDYEGTIDRFLVSSKTFQNLIRSFNKEDIEINKNEGFININSDGKEYKIRIIEEEYPFITIDEIEKEFVINKEFLYKGLQKVSFSIGDPQKTRLEFSSCLVEFKDENIKMISTDGNRLSFFVSENFKKDEANFSFLIPKGSVSVLERILELEEKEYVKLSFSMKSFSYTGGSIYFVSRLGQGNFPNYEMVLPRNEDKYIIVNRKNLIDSLQRLLLITREGSGKVQFDIKDKQLILKGSSIDIGEGVEEIEIIEGKGGSEKIYLDNKKVLEGIKTMDEENVKIIYFDGESPVTFKDSNKHLYIIMPYRSE
ncbi:MAG: DNA polymerase III subunit beta [Caldisericia bacterium]|nr:DNA polymerase III subunit beta [Caldisericia bacterium]